VGPFRVFGSAAWRQSRYRDGPSSPELAARSEYRSPKYRPYGLGGPAVPLAISSAMRFFLGQPAGHSQTVPTNLSSSFALRRSITQRILAAPAGAGRHLSWAFGSLQRSRQRRSTSRGRAAPATVRLQGLGTLLTACALRNRAGRVSYRRRSWDSPFGAFSSDKVPGAFPPEWTHLPFLPPVLPPPAGDGPARRAAVPGL
jgi:hypothetical protein